MKTFLLVFALSIISHCSYSQKQIIADSIFASKAPKKEVKIRCAASIRTNENPLYIVDGVLMSSEENILIGLNSDDIESIQVLKDANISICYGPAARNGIVLIKTKSYGKPIVTAKKYAFKTFMVSNNNWNTIQDMYNTIQAKVPSVSIPSNSNLTQVPNIRMRGDHNTIVIVNGIRYDTSILNTLNPSNIESITVATGAAASNYLINN